MEAAREKQKELDLKNREKERKKEEKVLKKKEKKKVKNIKCALSTLHFRMLYF
jgi:hypothetical protein